VSRRLPIRLRAAICALIASYIAFVATPAALADDPVSAGAAAVSCRGHFVNPITDVCWSCLLPITLGAIPIAHGIRPDSPNPASPICLCGTPIPRLGLEIGFWEPVRLADSTRKAWCFPSLGGVKMPVPFGFGSGSTDRGKDGSSDGGKTAQYHVHWYIFPLMYWLELLTDFLCLENASFDIGYVTELDPLWRDDELSAIISPEEFIFANPIALAACTADCVASSVGMPLQPMFWCAGCRGSMYPMTGNTWATSGDVEGSLYAVEKFTYKLHREGLAWGTRGAAAVCAKHFAPVIDKLQYRYQLTNPVPNVIGPFTCPTAGATTQTYEFFKEVPVIGEDFGYLVWRKRNCCAF
jgi:conjugal transfer pilus assembly protein TraU